MAERRRPPQETKDIGIKRLKESYEKNNRTACPAEKVKQFEKLYEKQILPQVYDGKK
jgi:hypothetical protein